MATYVSGLILNTTPLFNNKGQLHNYAMVFVLGAISYLLILFWTIFMVDEKRDIIEFEKQFNNNYSDNLNSDNSIENIEIMNKKLKQFKR